MAVVDPGSVQQVGEGEFRSAPFRRREDV